MKAHEARTIRADAIKVMEKTAQFLRHHVVAAAEQPESARGEQSQ